MKSLLQRPSLPDITVRIVIAEPGLDGHDRGAKVIVDEITPDADVRVLQATGVQAVFTPDAGVESIIEAVAQATADMAGAGADRS